MGVIGKAVQQNDRRAVTGFEIGKVQPIGVDMLHLNSGVEPNQKYYKYWRVYFPVMPQIFQSASTAESWHVTCLCAAWCDTCNEYRPALEALARQNPRDAFAWIDIEDENDLLGDIDVENFPTILIARGATPHFFGTVLPHIEQLQRLLDSAKANNSAMREPDRDVSALAERIQEQTTNLR
jgi:hypothetical protein